MIGLGVRTIQLSVPDLLNNRKEMYIHYDGYIQLLIYAPFAKYCYKAIPCVDGPHFHVLYIFSVCESLDRFHIKHLGSNSKKSQLRANQYISNLLLHLILQSL